MGILLEMNGISKSFAGVKALSNVHFKLKSGTVHALMGENGAGKSTLMKILSGMYQPDEGEIIVKGKNVTLETPRKALDLGISMIHQELSPISEMTIAENIFLGREPTKFGLINYSELANKANQLFDMLGIELNPNARMKELKVSEIQMVEIAKAISYDANVIIMDEPTSAITDREVDKLFAIIRDLKSKGKGIIYISHKMNEIFEITDEITVFRDGTYIGTRSTSETDHKELISMMVGRELKDIFPKERVEIGSVMLSVRNFSLNGKFENINFDCRKGEILGIAGLMGSGRTEVVEAIFGLRSVDSGELYLDNEKVKINSPKDAIDHGIALVTEDRKLQGLVLPLSVKHNITLSSLSQITRNGVINNSQEVTVVDEYIKSLRIKTRTRDQVVNSLSGGNQQKVVIAKWLLTKPKILILDEPTRGIDIGAKSEIYRLMNQFAAQGFTIIMISSELPEILGMSDRILVFHNGEISGELTRDEATQEKIMELATGQNKVRGNGKNVVHV